jgi:hypothetical protein
MSVVQSSQKRHPDLVLPGLPPLPLPLRPPSYGLLIDKFQLCEQLCDFNDLLSDLSAKEIKLHTLRELDVMCSDAQNFKDWPSDVIDSFFSMVNANIFRPISPTPRGQLLDEIPTLIEVTWPHLQLVYFVLLKYQLGMPTDPRFSLTFFRRLLQNLHAPDHNEHDLITTLVERYLLLYPENEPAILAQFSNFLNLYLDQAISPFAIVPILKFAVDHWRDSGMTPLFDAMFQRYFVRLIWSHHFTSFRDTLGQLLDVVITAEPHELEGLLLKVIAHIPVSAPSKQSPYLEFVHFIVDRMDPGILLTIAPNLFQLVSHYVQSEHSKVVEQSLKFCSEVKIMPFIYDNSKWVFPLICPAIHKTAKKHWNPSIQKAAHDSLRALNRLDPVAYADALGLKRVNMGNDPVPLPGALPAVAPVVRSWSIVARQANVRHKDFTLQQMLGNIRTSLGDAG